MIQQSFIFLFVILLAEGFSYSEYNRQYYKQNFGSRKSISPYTQSYHKYEPIFQKRPIFKPMIDQVQTQSSQSQPKCGVIKPTLRNYIAKGKSTPHTDYKWYVQVIIMSSDGAEAYCGGTIIERKPDSPDLPCVQWIVTAAHCFDDIKGYLLASSTTVRVKSAKVYNKYTNELEEVEIQAQEVIINPGYVPAMTLSQAKELGIKPGPIKDMALIKICVNDPAVLSQIVPACLPKSNDQTKTGIKCKILGHGFTDPKSEYDFDMPEHLQEADVKISENQECKAEVDSQSIKDKINDFTVCIKGDVHPCVGDSGGPLICKGESSERIHGDQDDELYYDYEYSTIDEEYYLIGVTSFAVSTDRHNQCGNFKSAVFGEVSNYIDWIWKCMEKSSALRFNDIQRHKFQLY